MRIILFLTVILLHACINENINHFDQIYDQSFEKAINTSLQTNQMMMHVLESAYQENIVKAKPYYEKGRTIQKITEDFINVDFTEIDADSLWGLYTATIDSLNNQLFSYQKDSFRLKVIDVGRLNIKKINLKKLHNILKSEIVTDAGNILGWLASCINTTFCGFTPVIVTTNKLNVNDKQYVFSLNSDLVQKVNVNDYKVEVDSILKNNKKTKELPNITPDNSFARISMDSLPSGNYSVFGKVIYYYPNGKSFEYPFQHQFGLKQ
jgi:hypothetical protein